MRGMGLVYVYTYIKNSFLLFFDVDLFAEWNNADVVGVCDAAYLLALSPKPNVFSYSRIM